MNRRQLMTWGLGLCAAAACDDDGDTGGSGPGPGGGGGGGGAWLVGSEGLMLAIDGQATPRVRSYDLAQRGDLLSIACRPSGQAWVTGTGGLVLRTDDRGRSWRPIDLGTTNTIRAVGLGAPATVFLIGEDGWWAVSHDDGSAFSRAKTGDTAVTFTGVAVSATGTRAVVASSHGLFHYDRGSGGLRQNGPLRDQPLFAVAMSPDGLHIAAVGPAGLVWESHDSGATFKRSAPATPRDLHAVWMSDDGATILAVGEAGVVIIQSAAVPPLVREYLGAALSFRGLHLDGDGTGVVVGDAGQAMTTSDGGLHWRALSLGTSKTVWSVDDLGD